MAQKKNSVSVEPGSLEELLSPPKPVVRKHVMAWFYNPGYVPQKGCSDADLQNNRPLIGETSWFLIVPSMDIHIQLITIEPGYLDKKDAHAFASALLSTCDQNPSYLQKLQGFNCEIPCHPTTGGTSFAVKVNII